MEFYSNVENTFLMEDFNEWLFKVCEFLSDKNKLRDPQWYFERIDLTDAKLQFIDNVSPEKFNF
jgi:hypothetical protein